MISSEIKKRTDYSGSEYMVKVMLDQSLISDYGLLSELPKLIAERLATEMLEEVKSKILGSDESTNTIFNLVVLELVKRISEGSSEKK